MDISPYLKQLGLDRKGRKKEKRKKVHLDWRGVPYTPQHFPPP